MAVVRKFVLLWAASSAGQALSGRSTDPTTASGCGFRRPSYDLMTVYDKGRREPSKEAFFAALDEGIKLATGDSFKEPPNPKDLKALEYLLAVFIGSTIQMNPEAMADPKVGEVLTSVRMTLLTAYNLGRNNPR